MQTKYLTVRELYIYLLFMKMNDSVSSENLEISIAEVNQIESWNIKG